jgi:FAD/FMN-containing dehydrogenase
MQVALFAAALDPQSAAQSLPLPTSYGHTYSAAYHYVTCDSDYVIAPRNTTELAEAIKAYRALAKSQGKTLKVRSSRRLFHSTTTFVCPAQLASDPTLAAAGGAGPEPVGVLSVAVLNEHLNTTLSHDLKAATMRVGTGMKLREFTSEATRVGLSIQVCAALMAASMPAVRCTSCSWLQLRVDIA